jgi:1-acyl-sn-glycerol-3-phosphate acyltransferase
MNNSFKKLYTIWCALVFGSIFLVLYPFFLIIIPFPAWHKYSFYLNRLWSTFALLLVGITVEIAGREKLHRHQQYVYCANHFSLIDILSFGFAPQAVLFVGKSSLAEIPLFGYMFRKIHIAVDRSSIKNSYNALFLAMKKMGKDKSLVMFPEGGVYTTEPPKMVKFKDGAFRAAIEKQIPVVPVSLPDNWIILPDDKVTLVKRRKMRIKFLDPIPTKGLNVTNIETLKIQVFNRIQEDLIKANTI